MVNYLLITHEILTENIKDNIDAINLGMTPPDTSQAVPPIALLGENAALLGQFKYQPRY